MTTQSDLSQGMARAMSQPILGFAIDMVPQYVRALE